MARWVASVASLWTLVAFLPVSTKGAEPRATPWSAYLLEVTLDARELEARDVAGALALPLRTLHASLRAAELAWARDDLSELERVKAEISAQLRWVEAVVSAEEAAVNLRRMEQQRQQVEQLLEEARTRVKEVD